MKRLNKLIAFALPVLMSCGMVAGCFLSSGSGAKQIKLNETEISLVEGETFLLTAVTDKEGAEVKWSCDDTSVAAVEDGLVTALSAGEATVTARSGQVRTFCEITVTEKVVPKPDPPTPPDPPVQKENLREIYEDYFKIGAAVQTNRLLNEKYGGLMKHFNSVTPENNIKWKNIQPTKGVYNFDQSGDSADKLVKWAKENGVGVRGHCLVWYKSLPSWLHDEFDGKEYGDALRNSALSYMENHIEAVMKHFGNDIYVWDVVNEALFNSVKYDDLTVKAQKPYGNIWRTNDGMSETASDWVDWYKVCGSYDYIAKAFIKADGVRKANNLKTELYYNDYSLNNPNKRQACLNLLQMLKDNNAPIDGVGMQSHCKLDDYLADKAGWLKNFEDSVKAFINAGVDVQITELDIRFDGELTEQRENDQAEMYGEIFKICRKYAKTAGKAHGITGVTTWGVQDGSNGAWGETFPLIFGVDKKPKKAYDAIINF